jgi:MFS family permease
MALALMCLSQSGAYFCYDFPSVLEDVIEREFKVKVTEYSLLYSVYSLPNIVLPIFFGFVLNSLGLARGLISTSFLSLLGMVVFAISGVTKSFTLALVGRAIYGAGCESLFVVVSVYVTKWFKDQELSFAMGVVASIPNFVSFYSGIIIPQLNA